MCGIFIAFSKNGSRLSTQKCIKISKNLLNRGPDFHKFSFFRKNTLFFSNTILSITGEPSKKKSITNSKNKQLFISFNGEIYNFHELNKNYLMQNQTEKLSDTEVLVNLHENFEEEKVQEIINGMYAYVVYNKKLDKLIISNDSQGEKNIFYYESENILLISSTIEAILLYLDKYQINQEQLKNYFFTRHYMPFKETCFKNIKIFNTGMILNYLLKSKKFKIINYDNPLKWISEKKYNEYNKASERDIISFFEHELRKQAKLMVPKINYGCIVSGGIDSSLQAAILNSYKPSYKNLVIDHEKKDPLMKQIYKFNDYFENKIEKIKMSKKIYSILANRCYKITSSPLYTHDLPSRLLLSNFFKKNKCKVFFSADGCDELFGGQQIYYNIFNKKYDYKLNKSPYTSLLNLSNAIQTKKNKYQNYLDEIWKKTLTKYSFIKSNKEQNIQSSLFLDYFMQSVNVANRSSDLISCSNSVEPRNIFISRNILKIVVNLPLKYKINYFEPNPLFRQKYLLKKIFSKYFDKKLIFSKQGFSGFPNALKAKRKKYELTKKVLKIEKSLLLKNIRSYYDKKNKSRDMEWKMINSERFLNIFLNNE
jgi:asparagine synthase (glutamine-hydrolysing)